MDTDLTPEKILQMDKQHTEIARELYAYREVNQLLTEKYGCNMNLIEFVQSWIEVMSAREKGEKSFRFSILTGETYDKWKEFQRYDEQGLVMYFPCPVGTHVYINRRNGMDKGQICGIAEADDIDCLCYKVYIDPDTYDLITLDDFGKSWFLTEEDVKKIPNKTEEQ